MRDGIPRGERRESIPVGRRQVSGVAAACLKAITLDTDDENEAIV
jgi:hypothetical protein